MNKSTKNVLLGAAMAGVLAVGVTAGTESFAKGGKGVHCKQSNECKGHGACKGAKNKCKGKNDCKEHVFEAKSKEDCEKAGGKVE